MTSVLAPVVVGTLQPSGPQCDLLGKAPARAPALRWLTPHSYRASYHHLPNNPPALKVLSQNLLRGEPRLRYNKVQGGKKPAHGKILYELRLSPQTGLLLPHRNPYCNCPTFILTTRKQAGALPHRGVSLTFTENTLLSTWSPACYWHLSAEQVWNHHGHRVGWGKRVMFLMSRTGFQTPS